MSITKSRRAQRQTGVARSASLAEIELKKLRSYGDPCDTLRQKADKLGVTSEGALRCILATGSGRGDNIRAIRTALAKLPDPS